MSFIYIILKCLLAPYGNCSGLEYIPETFHISTVLEDTLELHELLRHQERIAVVTEQRSFYAGKSF